MAGQCIAHHVSVWRYSWHWESHFNVAFAQHVTCSSDHCWLLGVHVSCRRRVLSFFGAFVDRMIPKWFSVHFPSCIRLLSMFGAWDAMIRAEALGSVVPVKAISQRAFDKLIGYMHIFAFSKFTHPIERVALKVHQGR